MVIYKFPPQGKDPESKGNEERKLPDFIYVDNGDHYENFQGGAWRERKEYLESIQKLGKGKYPFSLRILTFFASLATFFTSCIALILCLPAFIIAALLLFQVKKVNAVLKKYWKLFKRTLVISFGLIISSFSPSIGFGIILLYFLILGEKINNRFLAHMVNLSKQ